MPKLMTAITAGQVDHIWERHGPGGSAENVFDKNFVSNKQFVGQVAKDVYEKGEEAAFVDNSGRSMLKVYYNYQTRTGAGVDVQGKAIVFKGVELVAEAGTTVLFIETMYPKGILKQ